MSGFSDFQLNEIKNISCEQLGEFLKCDNVDLCRPYLYFALVVALFMFLILLSWIFESIPFWVKILVMGSLLGFLIYLFRLIS